METYYYRRQSIPIIITVDTRVAHALIFSPLTFDLQSQPTVDMTQTHAIKEGRNLIDSKVILDCNHTNGQAEEETDTTDCFTLPVNVGVAR